MKKSRKEIEKDPEFSELMDFKGWDVESIENIMFI